MIKIPDIGLRPEFPDQCRLPIRSVEYGIFKNQDKIHFPFVLDVRKVPTTGIWLHHQFGQEAMIYRLSRSIARMMSEAD
jgi:hypothetical protein